MHFTYVLYAATAALLLASLVKSRAKTLQALRVALKRFLKIAPAFALMLVCVAIALNLIGEEQLKALLAGGNRWLALFIALGVGSVSVMPGFIAFPLCGILLERGALYMVLSAFSMSLMLVGVVTFPLERAYLGTRLALVWNIGCLLVSALVALATGLAFGELP
jgi:uncharacterized membrane protein YraQ (UPF0718 family)